MRKSEKGCIQISKVAVTTFDFHFHRHAIGTYQKLETKQQTNGIDIIIIQ
jgi:hypothetical protein